MLNNRKIAIVVCVCLLLSSVLSVVSATEDQFKIGDYINIGTYKGIPITWRYVVDDENGKLLVSDKIICFKRFGSENSFWEESLIRVWLNSKTVIQSQYNGTVYAPYGYEKGFLSYDNFTQSESNLMKPVIQWTMGRSENGLTTPFTIVKETAISYGPPHEDKSRPAIYYDISDIPNIYYGAAYQLEDTVFLLDALQLYRMWEKTGIVSARRTDEFEPNEENDSFYAAYFLKHNGAIVTSSGGLYSIGKSYDSGIRPAFYLNEVAVGDFTGSGTIDDPYILAGDPDYISVQMNRKPLALDVVPIMENDRVLVPLRAIFEALGAAVNWNDDTQTVTAVKGDITVELQIGSDILIKNGENIMLDVPAQLIDGRTLVPTRAVAESFGATVDWNDENRQVIIIIRQ